MQRGHNNTVTGKIPILIPCSQEEQDGLDTFSIELANPRPVRALTDADFEPNQSVRKKAWDLMRDYEREKYRALIALVHGWATRDKIAIRKARKHVQQAYEQMMISDKKLGCVPASEDDVAFGRMLIQVFGLQPGQEKEAIRRFCGYAQGPRAKADLRWLLSQLVSEGVSSAKLVFWWSGKKFRPAFYCPDHKTALYVFYLMKYTNGRGWGVCPHCGEFFVKNRPDQDYCSIAHRESHRVARWREKKRSTARVSAASKKSRR